MKLYPLNLKLDGVDCVVVGGGRVAWRKVKGLLACGARVTVVSPAVCAELEALEKKGRIRYRDFRYQRRFLNGAQFVIAATDDPGINARVSRDACARNIFVNVVDDPQLCTVYLPSVVRADPVLVSLATSGCFPGLSKKMRQDLTPLLSEYSHKARLAGRLRQRVKQSGLSAHVKKRLIRSLLDPRIIDVAAKGRIRTVAELAAAANVRLPAERKKG